MDHDLSGISYHIISSHAAQHVNTQKVSPITQNASIHYRRLTLCVPDRKKKKSSVSSKKRVASTSSHPAPPAIMSTNTILEDLFPPVLNRFTPSNLKKTADYYMKEWEMSLTPPEIHKQPQPAYHTVGTNNNGT